MCLHVKEIQVVWSDLENEPPPFSFLDLKPGSRPVLFERQKTDSLNNRFRPLLPLQTEAVLSIDDDLLLDCQDLDFAYKVWLSSPKSMVGFFPRLVTFNEYERKYRYETSWKVVWWQGSYNMILTKCCFLSRDFLYEYQRSMNKETMDYIDERRNCEDIAMSFVVANATGGIPPVWVKAPAKDFGTKSGISQGGRHQDERSECVNKFVRVFGGMPLTLTSHKAIDSRKAWFY